MHYYFDESGDWSGHEERCLVLGGLLLRQAHTVAKLDAELKLLKTEHNLPFFHANEMSEIALEDCYSVISKTLDKAAAAMIRVYSPKEVSRSSRKNADDVYIELAAELISTLIIGDRSPIINYDMKFHYAYAENIIAYTCSKKPYHYKRVMEAHQMRDDKYQTELSRIMKRINALKGRRRQRIQWFIDDLPTNGPKAVSEYLWSELALQVQGKERTREIFRKTILDNLKRINKYNMSQEALESLQINYHSKDQGNAGIEMIDMLCNMVYRYGTYPPDNVSNTVKRIYDSMIVERC